MQKTLWDIFRTISKEFSFEGSTDMLEEFAARAVGYGYGKEETIKAVQEYFNQCFEVAESKYIRGLWIWGQFKAKNP